MAGIFHILAASLMADGSGWPVYDKGLDARTSAILFDVSREICRDPGLVSATFQVPKVEFKPVYSTRVVLRFAVPGDIPALSEKYGTLTKGGFGLRLYPHRNRAGWDTEMEAEIAEAFVDARSCPIRIIGALLEWYTPRAEKLPKIHP